MTLTERIRKLGEFEGAWACCFRAGYDDESEPGVKELVGGAKNENARLRPLITALSACAEAVYEHIVVEPGMYANECAGLGGADGLRQTLTELTRVVADMEHK